MKLPWPRNPLLVDLMAGPWNEIKALSLSWFVGLALVLRQIEAAGRWPQGLLDAFFAIIPKAEGDSTPLDSVPYVSYLLSIGFGPRFVWPILKNGSFPGSLTLFSAGRGVSSVDAWYATSH